MKEVPKYFECHITLAPVYTDYPGLEELSGKHLFKVSRITGDDVLGDKRFVYLTAKHVDEDALRLQMADMTGVLRANDIPYLRRKIEHILFDER